MPRRIVLILFLLIVVIAAGSVLGLEVFKLRAVVVEGCQVQPASIVSDLSGLVAGQSIFKINFGQVRKNIQGNPYFEVEEVSLLFPDRIYIKVKERVPTAAISYLGALILMDEEGEILEVSNTAGDLNAPVVTGMQVTSFLVGERIQSAQSDQVDAMGVVLSELRRQSATFLISEINVGDLTDINMVTTDGFRVRLGNRLDMEKKIQWLRTTLPLLWDDGYTGGTINLIDVQNAIFSPSATPTPPPSEGGDADGDTGSDTNTDTGDDDGQAGGEEDNA